MNRTYLAALLTTLTTAFAVTACDKSGADAQEQANKAQAEANKDINKANAEANKTSVGAQAEADKKIAQVQADFAKTREDYRHKVQSDLDALDKKIAEVDAKAKTATGAKKTELDANLAGVRTRREAFGKQFNTLGSTTATEWDGTKARLDKAWTDLKDAVDKIS